jgi:hypothetical protein
MTFDQFFACVFELADIWTASSAADEYTSFLAAARDFVAPRLAALEWRQHEPEPQLEAPPAVQVAAPAAPVTAARPQRPSVVLQDRCPSCAVMSRWHLRRRQVLTTLEQLADSTASAEALRPWRPAWAVNPSRYSSAWPDVGPLADVAAGDDDGSGDVRCGGDHHRSRAALLIAAARTAAWPGEFRVFDGDFDALEVLGMHGNNWRHNGNKSLVDFPVIGLPEAVCPSSVASVLSRWEEWQSEQGDGTLRRSLSSVSIQGGDASTRLPLVCSAASLSAGARTPCLRCTALPLRHVVLGGNASRFESS